MGGSFSHVKVQGGFSVAVHPKTWGFQPRFPTKMNIQLPFGFNLDLLKMKILKENHGKLFNHSMSKIIDHQRITNAPPQKSLELLMFGLPGVSPDLDFLNPVKFNGAFLTDFKRGVSLKDMQCHMVQMEF